MTALALAAGPALAGGTFTRMGTPDTLAIGISDDGNTVVGQLFFGPNFVWTRGEGVEVIGGGCSSGQVAVSGDGNTIVGCNVDSEGRWNAALYLGDSDWQDLGSVPGAERCDAFLSGAWDLTTDGTEMVGLAWLGGEQRCRAHGGLWDLVAGGPATDLGSLVEGRSSRANGISGDGEVIVGWSDSQFGSRLGAKWINGVPEYIMTEDGKFVGEAEAVNSDGTVIVGQNFEFGDSRFSWRWREGEGFTKFGATETVNATGGLAITGTFAGDMSEDGSVVVGFTFIQNSRRSMIYTDENGQETFGGFLKRNGIYDALDWDIQAVSGVTPDGKTFTGYGVNPDGFFEGFVVDLD
ncbi:hypothetical protein ABI59_16175 [Acidobacteria bacterium Mor1]|nr:hypothetical protein ABI59_16175 [Acidobacteria bacterium Mor1]